MSNEIIDAAIEDDVIALKKAFDDAMIPKLATAIEMKKQELASQIFNDEPEEEFDDTEDDVDVEEEEVEEYEDDETD